MAGSNTHCPEFNGLRCFEFEVFLQYLFKHFVFLLPINSEAVSIVELQLSLGLWCKTVILVNVKGQKEMLDPVKYSEYLRYGKNMLFYNELSNTICLRPGVSYKDITFKSL